MNCYTVKIYRLSDGLYIDDTDYLKDNEIWLEKIEVIPLLNHTWKVTINYLEFYNSLRFYGYESLTQVPCFIASYWE